MALYMTLHLSMLNWQQNAAPNLTCVCPINEAFTKLPYTNISYTNTTHTNTSRSTGNLTSSLGPLLAILTRHGLPDAYYSTNFTDGDLIYSQNGYPILVTIRNGSIFLNDAKLVGTDFIANSGAVHALDRVRLSRTLSFCDSFPPGLPPLPVFFFSIKIITKHESHSQIMGFLNTTTNITTPANADIYRNPANIPSPPPKSTPTVTPTAPISPPTVTPKSPAVRWRSSPLHLTMGVLVVEAWMYLIQR